MVLRPRSIAILAAVILALTLTSSVAATPATLSISARAVPKSVGQAGGSISLRVTVANATECVFASVPKVVGFNGRAKCTKGTLIRSGKLGRNSGKMRTIRLKVTASNSVSSVSAEANVKQGELTTPVKVTPPPTPKPARTTTTTTTTTTPSTTTTASTIPPTTTTTVPLPIVGLNCTSTCAYALSSPVGAMIFSWVPVSGISFYDFDFWINGGTPGYTTSDPPCPCFGITPAGYIDSFSFETGTNLPPPIWTQNGQDYIEFNLATGYPGPICDKITASCPAGTTVSIEAAGDSPMINQGTQNSGISNTITLT
jgi:hypothetical protein